MSIKHKVFKDPNTKTESFKKSLKGRVLVTRDESTGGYSVTDNLTKEQVESYSSKQQLHTIYDPATSTYGMTPFEVIRHRIDLSAYSEASIDVHMG